MLTSDAELHDICRAVRVELGDQRDETGSDSAAALTGDIDKEGEAALQLLGHVLGVTPSDPADRNLIKQSFWACVRDPAGYLPRSNRKGDTRNDEQAHELQCTLLRRAVADRIHDYYLSHDVDTGALSCDLLKEDCVDSCDDSTPTCAAIRAAEDSITQYALLFDLSGPVLLRALELSRQMEDTADGIADNAPVLEGIARVITRKIAAELTALIVQELVENLEKQGLLTGVPLTRNACRLYLDGSERSMVSVAVLRRLILRYATGKTEYDLCKAQGKDGLSLEESTKLERICTRTLEKARKRLCKGRRRAARGSKFCRMDTVVLADLIPKYSDGPVNSDPATTVAEQATAVSDQVKVQCGTGRDCTLSGVNFAAGADLVGLPASERRFLAYNAELRRAGCGHCCRTADAVGSLVGRLAESGENGTGAAPGVRPEGVETGGVPSRVDVDSAAANPCTDGACYITRYIRRVKEDVSVEEALGRSIVDVSHTMDECRSMALHFYRGKGGEWVFVEVTALGTEDWNKCSGSKQSELWQLSKTNTCPKGEWRRDAKVVWEDPQSGERRTRWSDVIDVTGRTRGPSVEIRWCDANMISDGRHEINVKDWLKTLPTAS